MWVKETSQLVYRGRHGELGIVEFGLYTTDNTVHTTIPFWLCAEVESALSSVDVDKPTKIIN